MSSEFAKVSCVIDTDTNTRVSQFYTRFGDAIRKEKDMNRWNDRQRYLAKEFMLTPVVPFKEKV
jgi:hypothetical protein